MARLGYRLGVLLSLTWGCAERERAPFIDPSHNSVAGSGTGVPTTTTSGGDATHENGGAGEGDTPSPGAGADVFDPHQIYLAGITTRLMFGAFAPLNEPDSYIVGFSRPAAGGALWGNRLFYVEAPGRLILFNPDVEPSERKIDDKALEDNDDLIPTAPCKVGPTDDVTSAVWNNLTGPDGRLIYTCNDDRDTWYENGDVVYAGPAHPYRLGYDDWALTYDGADVSYGVMKLAEGQMTTITGLPSAAFHVRAVRAHADGFHIALQTFGEQIISDRLQLYAVDASSASATKVGNYPLALGNVEAEGVLGPDDVFYRIDSDSPTQQATVRSLKVGEEAPVTVFTQTDTSKLAPFLLITGP